MPIDYDNYEALLEAVESNEKFGTPAQDYGAPGVKTGNFFDNLTGGGPSRRVRRQRERAEDALAQIQAYVRRTQEDPTSVTEFERKKFGKLIKQIEKWNPDLVNVEGLRELARSAAVISEQTSPTAMAERTYRGILEDFETGSYRDTLMGHLDTALEKGRTELDTGRETAIDRITRESNLANAMARSQAMGVAAGNAANPLLAQRQAQNAYANQYGEQNARLANALENVEGNYANSLAGFESDTAGQRMNVEQANLSSALQTLGLGESQRQFNVGAAQADREADRRDRTEIAGYVGTGVNAASGLLGMAVKPPDSDIRAKQNIGDGRARADTAMRQMTDRERLSPLADDFMSSAQPQTFEYRNPQRSGQGNRLGVMAQDLERSQMGQQIVQRDSRGQRSLDPGALLGALTASVGRLNERLRGVEERPVYTMEIGPASIEEPDYEIEIGDARIEGASLADSLSRRNQ